MASKRLGAPLTQALAHLMSGQYIQGETRPCLCLCYNMNT
jgi:hypothetical protein